MKYYQLLLFLFITCASYSQNEAHNWYFGNRAGLSFETNPPTALDDGVLSTNEGCSSISTSAGQLLFYTDGRTVWNKLHQPMSNANYAPSTNYDGLHGDPSSTSSGLIVPHPTESHLYYVFTLDEPHHDNANAYPNQGPADENGNPTDTYSDVPFHEVPQDDDGFNNGLNYSLVDMTLDNGLGDVVDTQKNVHLVTYDVNDPEEIKYKASEKITAVRSSDCSSIWLITHFVDRFYAFKIDENGVDTNPVVSQAGPAVTTDNYRRAALGYMKASPNGQKIIVANNTMNYSQDQLNNDDGDGNVYLFDFDNTTGQVTNPLLLIDNVNAYGVAFSSSSNKTYAAINNLTIYQWDLEANVVKDSGTIISNDNFQKGALQLGPDGRIYVALINDSTLGVIKNPEESGLDANYTSSQLEGAINLGNNNSLFGLPPFIQSLFLDKIDIVNLDDFYTNEVNLCYDESFTLSYDNITGADYTWSKDDEVLNNETSENLEVNAPENVSFPYTAFYKLEVNKNDGSCPLVGTAKITFTAPPEFNEAEIYECDPVDSDLVFYDLNEANNQITENLDLTDISLDYKYYLNDNDAFNDENEITDFTNYQSLENNQVVVAKILSNNVCTSYANITLKRSESPQLADDLEVIYCKNSYPETISLTSGIQDNEINNFSYEWSTGENSESIEINTNGSYSVIITDNITGCSAIRNYEVSYSSTPEYSIQIKEAQVSSNQIIIILSDNNFGEYEYAIGTPDNFQDSPIFENLRAGIYDIFIRDKSGCGIVSDRVGLLGIPQSFTPNEDNYNDFWRLNGVIATDHRIAKIYIFDRYGKHLFSFKPGEQGWDGTYKNEKMPSNDYWYRIEMIDGEIFRGNFTLKR
ncbi:T9SS type B sorting domain-containing protein [Psychroflexus halocasei]|uniref:Gliding motility-associated C-terminal domain-containing protein n=1 Tax=Psychroflexus halocasei TaxID=908615 RepID=A0A1H3YSR3_9FLAO|nr:T9SS type B sorting domain-containing protein [Psychroflexus halocasei]SEA14447.1 gliding motility-associated C-terminal domain-containing protein [Psychroflexus halocasei]